jgi:hypothetical protein
MPAFLQVWKKVTEKDRDGSVEAAGGKVRLRRICHLECRLRELEPIRGNASLAPP